MSGNNHYKERFRMLSKKSVYKSKGRNRVVSVVIKNEPIYNDTSGLKEPAGVANWF